MQMKNSTRHSFFYTSQMVLVIKNPLANAGNAGSISGSGDPLEEGMATHSSILFWRIPWTEEPGGLQSMGSRRVRHDWSDLACTPTRWYQGAIAHLIWAYLEKNRLCSLSESNPFHINYGENVLPKDSHLIKILFKKISPFETLEFFPGVYSPGTCHVYPWLFFLRMVEEELHGSKFPDMDVLQIYTSVAPND